MTWPRSGRAPIACGRSSLPRPATSPGNAWRTCSATSGWIPSPGRAAGRWSAGWISPHRPSRRRRRWPVSWASRRRSWSRTCTTRWPRSVAGGSTSSTPASGRWCGCRTSRAGPGWRRNCWRRAGSCTWSRGTRSRRYSTRLGLVVARDYFDSGPEVQDWAYTYTDGPALDHVRSVQFQHGVGEIITALVQAGLRIEFLHEFNFDAFGRFDSLRRQEDGTYWFPDGGPRVPLIFSVRASRGV